MRELMLENCRSDGLAAIFHEDEGEGYFFLYNPLSGEVLKQVQLYTKPTEPEITDEDVDVLWSLDEETAGLSVWGRMRALLEVKNMEEVSCALETPESPAIERQTLLSSFHQYFDRKTFLDARSRYWRTVLSKMHPDLVLPDAPHISLLETHTLISAMDSDRRYAAIFEDEGETGYLYVYGVETGDLLNHVHIYDRSAALHIVKSDVRVLWSADDAKCAVEIWGQLRGIIDLKKKSEGRVWIENRDTPGINDSTWLHGFQLM